MIGGGENKSRHCIYDVIGHMGLTDSLQKAKNEYLNNVLRLYGPPLLLVVVQISNSLWEGFYNLSHYQGREVLTYY